MPSIEVTIYHNFGEHVRSLGKKCRINPVTMQSSVPRWNLALQFTFTTPMFRMSQLPSSSPAASSTLAARSEYDNGLEVLVKLSPCPRLCFGLAGEGRPQ